VVETMTCHGPKSRDRTKPSMRYPRHNYKQVGPIGCHVTTNRSAVGMALVAAAGCRTTSFGERIYVPCFPQALQLSDSFCTSLVHTTSTLCLLSGAFCVYCRCLKLKISMFFPSPAFGLHCSRSHHILWFCAHCRTTFGAFDDPVVAQGVGRSWGDVKGCM
jgi:hypothetical protein